MAEKIGALLSDEESMRQIKELAAMFGGGEAGETQAKPDEKPAEEPLIDPVLLMKLMSGFSKPDKNCDLLYALKPLLSKDKQNRVDKAVRLLRLLDVYSELKQSGALSNIF